MVFQDLQQSILWFDAYLFLNRLIATNCLPLFHFQTGFEKLNGESIRIEVFRWDPTCANERPHFEKYEIPLSPHLTVLGALQYIHQHIDGTLVFNYSCEKQRCGSCALKIDEKISLGCSTPAHDGQRISPLPGFKVERDLVVDWEPYEQKMLELLPMRSEEPTRGAYKKEEKLAESASTCIRCFSCVGVCPTVDIKSILGFLGPAISVMLAEQLDQEARSRSLLPSILEANLEYCTRCYACHAVCPANINIVGCIQELQRISGSSDPVAKRQNEMTLGYF